MTSTQPRSARLIWARSDWGPLIGGLGLSLIGALLAPSNRDVVLAWVVAGIPIGLVMLQPDLGSALVLGALAVGVIAVSGAPRRWVLGVLAVAAAGVTVALTTPALSGYQRDRLVAFVNPAADPQGIGYQTRQVRIAIGSGGSWAFSWSAP
jgi:rod shape determining protein RodA